MSYVALEQKLRQVPEGYFAFVSNFLDFVLSKDFTLKPDGKAEEKNEKMPLRQLGQWKGQVWMADDFDETPDCFEEYM